MPDPVALFAAVREAAAVLLEKLLSKAELARGCCSGLRGQAEAAPKGSACGREAAVEVKAEPPVAAEETELAEEDGTKAPGGRGMVEAVLVLGSWLGPVEEAGRDAVVAAGVRAL